MTTGMYNFRDPEFNSLINRMHGTIELLVVRGAEIISASVTSPNLYDTDYKGVIFFKNEAI